MSQRLSELSDDEPSDVFAPWRNVCTEMADACSVTYSTTSPNEVENKSGMLSCSSVSRVVV